MRRTTAGAIMSSSLAGMSVRLQIPYLAPSKRWKASGYGPVLQATGLPLPVVVRLAKKMPLLKASGALQVIACTGSGVASLATTAEGRVFSWGASKRGQLGHGPGHAQSSQPSAIPGLERIVQVSAGWGHALALDGEPVVWLRVCA